MIRPCNDFVLLEKEKAEEKTASGIILTDKNTEKPTVGKVLAVNNGHEVDGKHVECCVKVNDRVIYEKYGGTEVKIDGQCSDSDKASGKTVYKQEKPAF